MRVEGQHDLQVGGAVGLAQAEGDLRRAVEHRRRLLGSSPDVEQVGKLGDRGQPRPRLGEEIVEWLGVEQPPERRPIAGAEQSAGEKTKYLEPVARRGWLVQRALQVRGR